MCDTYIYYIYIYYIYIYILHIYIYHMILYVTYVYIYIEINPGHFFSTRALPSLAPLHPRSPPQWALALAQGRPCDAPGAACGKHLWKHLWKNYVYIYYDILCIYIYIYVFFMTMWKHQWTCVKLCQAASWVISEMIIAANGSWWVTLWPPRRKHLDPQGRLDESSVIGGNGGSTHHFNQVIPTRFTLW